MATVAYTTNELGEPMPTTTDPHAKSEERLYRSFAAALGVPVEAASTPPQRQVIIPAAEVAELERWARYKPAPDDDDSYYERLRPFLGLLGSAS